MCNEPAPVPGRRRQLCTVAALALSALTFAVVVAGADAGYQKRREATRNRIARMLLNEDGNVFGAYQPTELVGLVAGVYAVVMLGIWLQPSKGIGQCLPGTHLVCFVCPTLPGAHLACCVCPRLVPNYMYMYRPATTRAQYC